MRSSIWTILLALILWLHGKKATNNGMALLIFCSQHTLSRIIKRQVLTNSMVAILTFWSSTDSDHVRAVPVALLSITTNHSGARFWPQKEKTSASTFFSLSFVMIFFSQKCRQFKISKIRQITCQKSPIDVFQNEKQPFLGEFSENWQH